jgi:hypothetical protein
LALLIPCAFRANLKVSSILRTESTCIPAQAMALAVHLPHDIGPKLWRTFVEVTRYQKRFPRLLAAHDKTSHIDAVCTQSIDRRRYIVSYHPDADLQSPAAAATALIPPTNHRGVERTPRYLGFAAVQINWRRTWKRNKVFPFKLQVQE